MKFNYKIKLLIAACTILSTLTACKVKGSDDNTRGLSFYNNAQYHSAVTAFEAAIAASENKEPDFYTNLGMTYIELDDFDAATTQFELALELDKEHRLALRGLGIVNLALENYEEALSYFSKSMALANGTLTAIEYDLVDYRSLAESRLGRYDAAIEGYTTLINAKYNESDHYFLRGQVYLLSGRHDEAVSDFKNAIELNKKDCNLYLNIYNSLALAGYEDEARNFLGQALTNKAIEDSKAADKSLDLSLGLSKDNEAENFNDDYSVGLIYFYLDDYINATLKLAPASVTNNDALLYLGKCYQASGDTEQAKNTFKKYLTYNNTNGYVYNQLGLISISENDYTAALAYFRDGILTKDVSFLQELRWNEIVCHEELRDFDTAFEKVSEYIKDYPNDADARKEYEFLKTR